jgi:hypothetical protein
MPYIADPQITASQQWVKMTNESQGIVRFYPAEESYAPDVMNERFPATHHESVTGFGVRAGHSDIFEWDVFATQEEADEAFEFLADGRIYSAEAA